MNDLFFACTDCKIFIDAGYRWAYWEFEAVGIVQRNAQVNIDLVLAATRYWNPPKEKDSEWLYEEIFPTLEKFLFEHGNHFVIFGEEEDFNSIDSENYFDWLQIGFLPKLTPRYLAEILKFNTWEEVIEYVDKQQSKPRWWRLEYEEDHVHQKGKEKFLELVNQ